jgi:hypothetical protein
MQGRERRSETLSGTLVTYEKLLERYIMHQYDQYQSSGGRAVTVSDYDVSSIQPTCDPSDEVDLSFNLATKR